MRFSGHETFPFRYLWPAKAVRGLLRDQELFKREDALVTLGVGKNMVKSIRYWGEALGIIARDPKTMRGKPTRLGLSLFGPEGWDPFLEDPVSLWILHWRLVRSAEMATSWYYLFSRWRSEDFGKATVADWLYKVAQENNCRISKASVKRDVDVFVRTYVPARPRRDLPLEETFDSPLVELGLLQLVSQGTYRFQRGFQRALPPSVFVYSLLDFWQMKAAGRESLGFEEILHSAGSPGEGFKLSESALALSLQQLPDDCGLTFDETAGLRQVYGSPKGEDYRFSLLQDLYQANNLRRAS